MNRCVPLDPWHAFVSSTVICVQIHGWIPSSSSSSRPSSRHSVVNL
ncbi:hypothetical protein HanRHA438_Chr04g0164991 [Helianthus annuus]|nr:hypothetical protein HanRHA438_Chr04g0164991 [Helianthus annuus]